MSQETKEKIRLSNKGGNSGSFKKGFIPANKGKGLPSEGDKKCKVCGKLFHFQRSKTIRGKYISYSNPIPKTCSKECRYKLASEMEKGKLRPQTSGKNHYAWKGGITSIPHQIRTCAKYMQYRKNCFKRDYWACQKCGYKGKNINMDHIVSLARIIEFYQLESLKEALSCEKLWDLINVRTLCINCHSKTPSYMTKISKHPKFS